MSFRKPAEYWLSGHTVLINQAHITRTSNRACLAEKRGQDRGHTALASQPASLGFFEGLPVMQMMCRGAAVLPLHAQQANGGQPCPAWLQEDAHHDLWQT